MRPKAPWGAALFALLAAVIFYNMANTPLRDPLTVWHGLQLAGMLFFGLLSIYQLLRYNARMDQYELTLAIEALLRQQKEGIQ